MPVITHNALNFLLRPLHPAHISRVVFQGSCHNLHSRKGHILMTYKACFQMDSQPASIVTPLRHKIPIDASWTGFKRPRHMQLVRN